MESSGSFQRTKERERSSERTMEPILFPHDPGPCLAFTPVSIEPFPAHVFHQIVKHFRAKTFFFSNHRISKKFRSFFRKKGFSSYGDEYRKRYNWESLTSCFSNRSKRYNFEESFEFRFLRNSNVS